MEQLVKLDRLISIGQTIMLVEIFAIIILSIISVSLFLIWIELQRDIKRI